MACILMEYTLWCFFFGRKRADAGGFFLHNVPGPGTTLAMPMLHSNHSRTTVETPWKLYTSNTVFTQFIKTVTKRDS